MSKALPWVLNLAGGSGGGATYSAGTGIEITAENVINNTIDSYDELNDRPSINGTTLTGNKTSEDLGMFHDLVYYEKDNNTIVFEKTIYHSNWGSGNLNSVYDSVFGDNFASYWLDFLNECLETGWQNTHNYMVMIMHVIGPNSQQYLDFVYNGSDYKNKYPSGNVYGGHIIEFHECKQGVSNFRQHHDSTWFNSTTKKYTRIQLSNIENNKLTGLAVKNTIEYTPTEDYHPATKKYVDDNAGGGGGTPQILPIDITITETNAGLVFSNVSCTTGANIENDLIALTNVRANGQEAIGAYHWTDNSYWVNTFLLNIGVEILGNSTVTIDITNVNFYLPYRNAGGGDACSTKVLARLNAKCYVKRSEWNAKAIQHVYSDISCTTPMTSGISWSMDTQLVAISTWSGSPFSTTGWSAFSGYDYSKAQQLVKDANSGVPKWVDIS